MDYKRKKLERSGHFFFNMCGCFDADPLITKFDCRIQLATPKLLRFISWLRKQSHTRLIDTRYEQ